MPFVWMVGLPGTLCGLSIYPVLGIQFTYLGEFFPTHLRAKGMCLGIATMSLMNIIWLQSAPTALK